jgi:hypothetical protein
MLERPRSNNMSFYNSFVRIMHLPPLHSPIDLSGAAQLNVLYQQQAALLNESRRLIQQNAAHQALLQQNQHNLATSDMSGFLSHPPRPLWGNAAPGMWLNQGLLPSSAAGSHVANQLSILTGGGSGWDSNLIGSSGLGTAETALARLHQQFPMAALAGTSTTTSNINDQPGSMHPTFVATRGRQPFLMSPQGQFLGGMPSFAMPDASTGFGLEGGYMGGLPTAAGIGTRRNDGEGFSVGDAVSSSMTPAGIPHQDLYAQDAFRKADDESESNVLLLYIQSCDDDNLSAYQCLVRKQIELFEAKVEDVESNAQGRNKPIVSGQVGIRCRHCSRIPPRHRTRGATYYPAKLNGLYQAAQNMASAHLSNHCHLIPDILRQELILLRDRKSSAGGGKQYWADGVRVLGVIESNGTLRFDKRRDDRIKEDKPEIKQHVDSTEQIEIKHDDEDKSTVSIG